MYGPILIFLSFMIGSIPTGYILVKTVRKHDIRESGSGNIGFTNVLRNEGIVLGTIVLVVDVAKAFAAPFFFSSITSNPPLYRLLMGIAVILGNIFTPFLRFKGGKGVASGLGVALAVNPPAALIALCIFGIVVKITRYISLGSLSAAGGFALSSVILYAVSSYGVYSLIFGLLIFFVVTVRHISNIKRLLQGRENKIGKEKKSG